MISLVFKQEVPDNYRKHIEKMVRELDWIFPAWIQEIVISWGNKTFESYAAMVLQKEYRTVKLTLTTLLMEMPLKFQRDTIIHEHSHCFNVPLSDIAFEILDSFLPYGADDEDENTSRLYKLWSKRIEEARESVNSDLAFSIGRHLDGLEKK